MSSAHLLRPARWLITSHARIPEMDWSNWYSTLPVWLLSLANVRNRLPLLAVILAVVGYFAVRVLWYWDGGMEMEKRAARRQKGCKMSGAGL